MKIASIRTYAPRVPLGKERFFSSQCAFPERNSLLVRLETDDGLVGWGEGGQYGPPEPVAACLEHVLAPHVLGRSPHEAAGSGRALCAQPRLRSEGPLHRGLKRYRHRPVGFEGQVAGRSIHNLLGGAFRASIAAYATGCYYRGDDVLNHESSLEKLAAEAASYVRAGSDC